VEPSSETGQLRPVFSIFIGEGMIEISNERKVNTSQSIGIDLDQSLRNNKKVLIVDDDPDTVELVKRILRLAEFDVASAINGAEAIMITEQIKPDIILLDLMMPDIDGRETLKKLRQFSQSPIVVLSALEEKDHVVDLLNLGSDDYITKPFHRDELVARMQAVLRRTKLLTVIDGVSIPEIGLTVNFSKREVTFQGEFVQLSPKEFELIELISKKIPHIVKYDEIAIELWGENSKSSKNRIKYLVHSIRRKLEEINSDVEVIINSSRIGYRIQTN
jgi:DNA-binding response OmpR family regulator